MTPASERKAKERKAKRDAGLVRVEVWVHPVVAMQIKLLAQELTDDLSRELPKVTTTS